MILSHLSANKPCVRRDGTRKLLRLLYLVLISHNSLALFFSQSVPQAARLSIFIYIEKEVVLHHCEGPVFSTRY